MVQALGLPVLLGAAFSLSGCQGAGAFAQVNERLSQIADSQTQILSRLDALEAKIEEGIKAAPAAPQGKQQPQQPRPNQPDPTATYKVPVGDAHTKGSDEALVTIVEWSDFQCPYCSRVTPTIKQIAEQYGDEVRVAFKHNPLGFHPRAKPAALAAEAAGKQGKFWEMHDKLFENQKDLTDENFVAWAGELGLDVEQFKKDLADPSLAKKVDGQQAQGMTVGARGTPAFFINGRFLSGAQPLENFKKLIDEEKAKAEKLVAAGTPKNKVYEKVIEKGKPKV
ncbi:MAG: thioredoxin domain-containing protein [Myxococcales bacterium]|nr:thioredoxin domain-containing protein [Myxococcales bacterium]MCB9717049.1 thioredoxin domain-containing protein [Myxococcales bacterium]